MSKETTVESQTEPRGLSPKAKAALLVVAPAVLLGALNFACDDEAQRIAPTPTPRPTPQITIDRPPSADDQVVEITPRETAIPSPPREVTPTSTTSSISETPIPTQPQTETPAPTETTQPKNYEITILPPANPDHPAYETYTIEQARRIIEEILANYPAKDHPVLGQLKIEIGLGSGRWYHPDNHTIIIDRASPDIYKSFLHEEVHSWLEVFKSSNNQEMLNLVQPILSDAQVGRDYPQIDRIFSGNVQEALIKYQGAGLLGLEDLRTISSEQANGVWIDRLGSRSNPFLTYIDNDFFTQNTQPMPSNSEDLKTFNSALDFLNSPQMASLAQEKPAIAHISNYLKSRVDMEEFFLKINPMLYGDKQTAQYVKAYETISFLVLAEGTALNDQAVIGLIPQEDMPGIQTELTSRREQADGEKIAELIAVYAKIRDEKRLAQSHPGIEAFIQKNSRTYPN